MLWLERYTHIIRFNSQKAGDEPRVLILQKRHYLKTIDKTYLHMRSTYVMTLPFNFISIIIVKMVTIEELARIQPLYFMHMRQQLVMLILPPCKYIKPRIINHTHLLYMTMTFDIRHVLLPSILPEVKPLYYWLRAQTGIIDTKSVYVVTYLNHAFDSFYVFQGLDLL